MRNKFGDNCRISKMCEYLDMISSSLLNVDLSSVDSQAGSGSHENVGYTYQHINTGRLRLNFPCTDTRELKICNLIPG